MLSGGEKYKIKTIIEKNYSLYLEMKEILNIPNYQQKNAELEKLYQINKNIFKSLANLPHSILTTNQVVSESFDLFQDININKNLNINDKKQVKNLLETLEIFKKVQSELIKIIKEDNNIKKDPIEEIADDLDIEIKKSKSKSDDFFSIDEFFED